MCLLFSSSLQASLRLLMGCSRLVPTGRSRVLCSWPSALTVLCVITEPVCVETIYTPTCHLPLCYFAPRHPRHLSKALTNYNKQQGIMCSPCTLSIVPPVFSLSKQSTTQLSLLHKCMTEKQVILSPPLTITFTFLSCNSVGGMKVSQVMVLKFSVIDEVVLI